MKRDNSTTERLFRAAGLSEGMTVLELGWGPGEVTELLCEIVGSAGSVIAIDRSVEMISSARQRAENAGKRNVFVSGMRFCAKGRKEKLADNT
ncbi:methyltransferase domain-containing protein [Arenicella xantha]|uniref:Methyltransferase family protein n=1 Tax=Arenicella xantha TaxID=644221 RepID=A0A395JUA0_9GAMM|nr:methyltransferase domain-containing protein [Arenicella xantha]RBP53118.1 methyltransferase family protein [Arenicella xantha]